MNRNEKLKAERKELLKELNLSKTFFVHNMPRFKNGHAVDGMRSREGTKPSLMEQVQLLRTLRGNIAENKKKALENFEENKSKLDELKPEDIQLLKEVQKELKGESK